MQLLVNVKRPGKRSILSAVPFTINSRPETARELISALARACAEAYNARANACGAPSPLADGQIDDMAKLGKIAFGMLSAGAQYCPERAAQTAINAFEDGLFRVFINDSELTPASAPLSLNEGDALTLIRLTMLTGVVC